VTLITSPGVQGAAGPGEDHLQPESGPAASPAVVAAADRQQWTGHPVAPPPTPQPPPPVATPPQFRGRLIRLHLGGRCSSVLIRRIRWLPCPHSGPAAAPPANPGAEFGRQAQLVHHLLKQRNPGIRNRTTAA